MNTELLDFTPDYFKSLGYEVVSDDGIYGVAESRWSKGFVLHKFGNAQRIIKFNRNGNWITIREDGDSRTSFHGTADTKDQFEMLLRLCK